MWSARRFLPLVALAAAWGAAQTKSVQPIIVGRKVALVIGNSNYRYIAGVPPAANDADDMAAALRRLRFEVVDVRKDLTADGLIEEVGRFSRTRVQPGGRRNRTLLGCTTCWGTSGGGWRIGTRTSTPAEANAIRPVRRTGSFVCCAAVPGTTIRGTCARRTVSGSYRWAVATISVSGVLGTSLSGETGGIGTHFLSTPSS